MLATEARDRSGDDLEFEQIYDEWFDEVTRWAAAFGGFPGDQDDIAQDVFLVVQRRLPSFDGVNLEGWLYKITKYVASDYRRRAWFRRWVFGARASADPGEQSTPAESLERRQLRGQLRKILDSMSVKHRTAFVLFEIQGYSGEEIAELEGVPIKTVWTRLHHARKDFVALARKQLGEP